MACPKCGKPVAQGATFCMYCGQSIAPMKAAPMQPMQPVAQPQGQPYMAGAMAAPAFPAPSSSRRTTWLAVGTALAMVLAIFFGLRAAGVLKMGAANPKLQTLQANGKDGNLDILKANSTDPNMQTLKAEGSDPNLNTLKANAADGQTPLFRAEGSNGPSVMQQTAERIKMPDDIRKWLEHLERIEKRKNDLAMQQVANMMVLMQKMKVLGGDLGALTDPDSEATSPTDTAQSEFKDLTPEWNKLISDFQAYPPPAECKPIADDYNHALNEIPGMMADITDLLKTAASDPQNALTKAYKLQNTSSNGIDKYLGRTDDGVGDICRKYETSKWFSIKTDVGGGLMSKFGI